MFVVSVSCLFQIINLKNTKQMENPKIKTKVVHSQSKTAWNVIGQQLGGKYKIARIPYLVVDDSEILTTKNKHEALVHAQFISQCFNHSDRIVGEVF